MFFVSTLPVYGCWRNVCLEKALVVVPVFNRWTLMDVCTQHSQDTEIFEINLFQY